MKQKILFVLPSLRGGGAERIMITLLNSIDREKFDLHLALVAKEGPYINNIAKDVKIYDLQAGRVRHLFRPFLRLIHELEPDTIFSTMGHLNLALILLRIVIPPHTRLVVREATIITESIKRSQLNKLWAKAYRCLYKKADLIICQSNYMKSDLMYNYGIPESKLVQIYNPVDVEEIQKKSDLEENPFVNSLSQPNILAVGRLEEVKGYDRLINAVPELVKEKPRAKVWILGEGSMRESLQRQIERLRLNDYVKLCGFTENPYRWLKYADLFVVASYYEGLPNALIEALGCGCPVFVLDHPGGTREIMELLGLEDRIRHDIEFSEDIFIKYDVTRQLKKHFGIKHIIKKYEVCLVNNKTK